MVQLLLNKMAKNVCFEKLFPSQEKHRMNMSFYLFTSGFCSCCGKEPLEVTVSGYIKRIFKDFSFFYGTWMTYKSFERSGRSSLDIWREKMLYIRQDVVIQSYNDKKILAP